MESMWKLLNFYSLDHRLILDNYCKPRSTEQLICPSMGLVNSWYLGFQHGLNPGTLVL